MTYRDSVQNAGNGDAPLDGGRLEKELTGKFDNMAILSAMGCCTDARAIFDSLTSSEKMLFRRYYSLVANHLKI